jgi:uncharacterized membrane protein
MPVRTALLILMLLAFLFTLVQIQVLQFAFEKLGLTPGNAMVILFATLFGSGINLPLFSIKNEIQTPLPEISLPKLFWQILEPKHPGRTVIAVNVGGCIIPLALSIYLISLHTIAFPPVLLGVSIVTAISFQFSSVIPGLGVGMPVLVAPLASASVALLIDAEHAAQLAYISGVLGVLIGADLLRLPEIGRIGTPVASIGGAGTFDGIFITGIMAALLA